MKYILELDRNEMDEFIRIYFNGSTVPNHAGSRTERRITKKVVAIGRKFEADLSKKNKKKKERKMPNMREVAPDEKCISCNHEIADHGKDSCNGVYNVYDVHGDETVGCMCKAFN